jgi:hypothetical protein
MFTLALFVLFALKVYGAKAGVAVYLDQGVRLVLLHHPDRQFSRTKCIS